MLTKPRTAPGLQQGMMLIEALLGILIFSIGILALVAMQASAVSQQTDAQVRVEAANMIDQLVSKMWVNVDPANIANSLSGPAGFQHQPTENAWCSFSGGVSANPIVTNWINDLTANPATRLPGTTASMISIAVDPNPVGPAYAYNKVTVQVCWKAPTDAKERKHTVVTHINANT
jgi:type IV pilus assembly protein PilV